MAASSVSLSLPRSMSLSLAEASRPLRIGVSNLLLNSVVVPGERERVGREEHYTYIHTYIHTGSNKALILNNRGNFD